MRCSLVGAELEENLGRRYMAAALESVGHAVRIVPFAAECDIPAVVRAVLDFDPAITGLSMGFTGRAREFCKLAQELRKSGYRGHLVVGGHFASFNCERLLRDFAEFDSFALGEGEQFICALADNLADPSKVSGICCREPDGSIVLNPSRGNPDARETLRSKLLTAVQGDAYDLPASGNASSAEISRFYLDRSIAVTMKLPLPSLNTLND